MGRKKKIGKNEKTALEELLDAADTKILRQLVALLTAGRPQASRECLEFLEKHARLEPSVKARAQADVEIGIKSEEAWNLWWDVFPDLSDMDELGGAGYETENHVGEQLYDLAKKLDSDKIQRETRQEILEEVLPFIKSENSGMVDELYDIAYAACRTRDERLYLAQSFETLGPDWAVENARRIYREIGDREKYLELRLQKMKLGSDFHDLATFYWESGEKEKAVDVAKEGMKKGGGRMDELREFLADTGMELIVNDAEKGRHG